MKTILVTGAAGFIGYHLCKKLLSLEHAVIGIDNLNDYYDVKLKLDRLKQLGIDEEPVPNCTHTSLSHDRFKFVRLNLEDKINLPKLFSENKIDIVCNLAAQAGVRYSIENPMVYIESNIVGFMNLLECVRTYEINKLVYASSSSVYGMNEKIPFSIHDNVDFPISIYAASKKSNELMAHVYSHLYGIKTVGLRFFTVYGPWGRPDMAMFLFTKAILEKKPIKVFNKGQLSRDFTFIDDIIEGVLATLLLDHPQKKQYSIYNIGNSQPVRLMDFISEIERHTGVKARKEMMPMQPGDVVQTWADVEDLQTDFGYKPNTPITVGVEKFISWYMKYYSK